MMALGSLRQLAGRKAWSTTRSVMPNRATYLSKLEDSLTQCVGSCFGIPKTDFGFTTVTWGLSQCGRMMVMHSLPMNFLLAIPCLNQCLMPLQTNFQVPFHVVWNYNNELQLLKLQITHRASLNALAAKTRYQTNEPEPDQRARALRSLTSTPGPVTLNVGQTRLANVADEPPCSITACGAGVPRSSPLRRATRHDRGEPI